MVTTSHVAVLDAVVVGAEIWANAARAAWFAGSSIYRFHSRRIMSWTWAVRNPTAYTECVLAPFLVKNETSFWVPRFSLLVDARWVSFPMYGNGFLRKNVQPLVLELAYRVRWDENKYAKVAIRPSFAQYTNPSLPQSNSTVFRELATSSGPLGLPTVAVREVKRFLQTTLSLMLVNGMARTAPYT